MSDINRALDLILPGFVTMVAKIPYLEPDTGWRPEVHLRAEGGSIVMRFSDIPQGFEIATESEIADDSYKDLFIPRAIEAVEKALTLSQAPMYQDITRDIARNGGVDG